MFVMSEVISEIGAFHERSVVPLRNSKCCLQYRLNRFERRIIMSLVSRARPFFLNARRRRAKKGSGEPPLPFSFCCPQILGTLLIDC